MATFGYVVALFLLALAAIIVAVRHYWGISVEGEPDEVTELKFRRTIKLSVQQLSIGGGGAVLLMYVLN